VKCKRLSTLRGNDEGAFPGPHREAVFSQRLIDNLICGREQRHENRYQIPTFNSYIVLLNIVRRTGRRKLFLFSPAALWLTLLPTSQGSLSSAPHNINSATTNGISLVKSRPTTSGQLSSLPTQQIPRPMTRSQSSISMTPSQLSRQPKSKKSGEEVRAQGSIDHVQMAGERGWANWMR
jgi:hypothetical protein